MTPLAACHDAQRMPLRHTPESRAALAAIILVYWSFSNCKLGRKSLLWSADDGVRCRSAAATRVRVE